MTIHKYFFSDISRLMASESDIKKLEFLATKSRKLLDDQVSSYTGNHDKAGRIITVNTLFISFFLFILKEVQTQIWIVYVSVVPFLLLFIAIFFLLRIFASRKIHQGFNEGKLDELYKKDYEQNLMYEIRANKTSIMQNSATVSQQNRRLNTGIILTYIAGIIFTILIILSQTYQRASQKEVSKTRIETMSDQKNTENTETPKTNSGANQPAEQPAQDNSPFPPVPIEDLTNFEKGDSSKKEIRHK